VLLGNGVALFKHLEDNRSIWKLSM
jgi:hypothetical protein